MWFLSENAVKVWILCFIRTADCSSKVLGQRLTILLTAIRHHCKTTQISSRLSSTFSSLITTIARFEELGCTLDGIVKIKDRYTHFGREERDLIPAFKMTVKEA